LMSMTSALPSPLVMVCTPARVGDVTHHQHAMTAKAASLIAEPSAHYLLKIHTLPDYHIATVSSG
ncbi:MAG TPA: hypothetical protein VFA12_19385, partial [Stellaceae bacterium]|nr:hypothetical protein [Stellaceae bacterium]